MKSLLLSLFFGFGLVLLTGCTGALFSGFSNNEPLNSAASIADFKFLAENKIDFTLSLSPGWQGSVKNGTCEGSIFEACITQVKNSLVFLTHTQGTYHGVGFAPWEADNVLFLDDGSVDIRFIRFSFAKTCLISGRIGVQLADKSILYLQSEYFRDDYGITNTSDGYATLHLPVPCPN